MRLFLLSAWFLLIATNSNSQIIEDAIIDPILEPLITPVRMYVDDYSLECEYTKKRLFINDACLYQYIDSSLFSGDLYIRLINDYFSDTGYGYTIGTLEGGVKNGKKEGRWIETSWEIPNISGFIPIKNMNYANGLLNGDYCVFNAQGDTLAISSFKQGTGLIIDFYYDTGALKEKGKLINGKKEGRWVLYDEEGDVIKSSIYKNDYCITQ